MIIAFCYDYDHRTSTLVVNDRLTVAMNAFAPAGLTSRKLLGRHAWMELFFHGDLAEVLIFNRALAPSELLSMTRHLASKYDIAIDPSKLADLEN